MSPYIEIHIRLALETFNLELECQTDKRCLGLFGHSGAGKTTCLQAVAGLRAAKGKIRFGDQVLQDTANGVYPPPQKRNLGYVPQDHRLFPHWNVRKNLYAGSARSKVSKNLLQERYKATIQVLELERLLERSIDRLSGGERQRVALGRALCSMPEILLLDEPMASLDSKIRNKILPYLVRIKETFDLPMLIVSHNPVELQALCDEVIVLEKGKVIARGNPVEVLSSNTHQPGMSSEDLENLLTVEITEQKETASIARISGVSQQQLILPKMDQPVGSSIQIGIGADTIIIAKEATQKLSAQNCLQGIVAGIHDHTNDGLLHIRVDEQHLLAVEISQNAITQLGLTKGQSVYLIFKSNAIKLYR